MVELSFFKSLKHKDIEVVPNLMDFDEYRKRQSQGHVFRTIEDAIV